MEYFDFEYNVGEEIDDFKLQELKHSEIQHPRNFILHEPYWSESLLRSFVDIFRHFAEKGILWDSLQVVPKEGYLSSTSHYYLRPLLFAANTLNLFREINVCAPMVPGDEKSGIESILSGALLNTRLESLSISCPFDSMAEGDFQALLDLLRQTTTLQELTLNRLAIPSREVADALVQNKTLQRISLNVIANDKGLSTLIEALSGSDTLQELTIQTDNQFGPCCSLALQNLLLSSKTLKSLVLQDNSPFCQTQASRKLNLINLLTGLKGSRSIQSLSMKNVFCSESTNMVLSQFFRAIPFSSNLERLDLLRTKITQEDLEVVSILPRLQKPFRLNLDRRILLHHTRAMRRMLERHPEIRRPWPRTVVAETTEGSKLKHVWELNWHGRSLLQKNSSNRSNDAPLSLWPAVLEKANDKPDVLFAFLQGPAFAGSQNHI